MKTLRNSRGQLFILASFIALLLLSSIPLIVFFTHTYASHQINQLRKSKSVSMAQTGISYISHELNGASDIVPGTTWTNALAGNFGAASGSPDCGTTLAIAGVGSIKFTCLATVSPLAATLAPNLEPYQVAVIATAYVPQGSASGNLVPTRAMEAYFSKRTLGITLPNGVQAGAALQLARVPTSNQTTQAVLAANALRVQWGPIVCYQLAPSPPPALAPQMDPSFWLMPNPLDTTPATACPPAILCPGYPRKFSNGGLTGASGIYTRAQDQTVVTTTDNYEWWAFASLMIPPQVHKSIAQDAVTAASSYQAIAEAQTTLATGLVTLSNVNCPHTATLNNHVTTTAAGCSLLGATGMLPGVSVLYIDGTADVTIPNIEVNVNALIVTNNLIITNPLGTGTTKPLPIPTTAYKEYLAITSAQTGAWAWPCGNATTAPTAQGATCSSGVGGLGVGNINFTGFLFVAGNMTVNTTWNMNGALAVGDLTHQFLSTDPTGTGQLIIPAGGQLNLSYNATIAHSISVFANELQIDSLQEANPQ